MPVITVRINKYHLFFPILLRAARQWLVLTWWRLLCSVPVLLL